MSIDVRCHNLLRTVQLIPKSNLQKQIKANIYLRFNLLNRIYKIGYNTCYNLISKCF
jgi:hypothetical protein